jgi:hypothetical protein
MVNTMKSGPPGNSNPAKRIAMMGDLSANRNIISFVTEQSIQFFTALNLPVDFLQIDPGKWCYNSEFKTELKYVKGLKVVNDTAERVVALIQEFNADLTRNEEQKQLLI